MSEVPCDIYVEKLSVYGHGFPVWMPDPSGCSNRAYCDEGVRVGDVGIMTDEYDLDYMFNITESENNPRNQPYGVPSPFSSLPIGEDDIHPTSPYIKRNAYIGVHTVRSFDIQLGETNSHL